MNLNGMGRNSVRSLISFDPSGVSMRYRTASFMSTWRGGANGDGMSVRRVNLKHGEEMSQLRFIRGYSRGDLWNSGRVAGK